MSDWPSLRRNRGKRPRNMRGCRWYIVSMGFWRPVWQRQGHKSHENSPLHHTDRTQFITCWLTKLCFLHEHLSKSPADPSDERGQQDHDETLQIKLSGLESEHEQTTGYQQHHKDKEWVLLGAKKSDNTHYYNKHQVK